MPEGHSIHRVADHFTEQFLHEPLTITSPQGRFTDGAALIDGRTAVAAEAYGKHFFLYFDNDRVLNVHLGMYGAWTFGSDAVAEQRSSIGAPRKIGEREVGRGDDTASSSDSGLVIPEPTSTTRVRLVGEHAWADLVGASTVRTLTVPEAQQVIDSIGPDPLREDADPERFFTKLASTRRAIGITLMDQSVIGGIGNIYRAEGLFRAGLNPHTASQKLPTDLREQIWDDQVFLMGIGQQTGRIITTAPQHRPEAPDLADAWPDHANYVYQRHGQSCLVCGRQDSIVMEMMQNRKLYWCTHCQRYDVP